MSSHSRAFHGWVLSPVCVRHRPQFLNRNESRGNAKTNRLTAAGAGGGVLDKDGRRVYPGSAFRRGAASYKNAHTDQPMNPPPTSLPGHLPRRGFLSQLGRGAAGLSALRWLPPLNAATGWVMRLSTSSIMFRHLPIEQVCERLAGLGFEAIDIWSAHEGCPHLDDVATRLGGAGLKAVLRQHRLALCSFSVYAGGYPRYAALLGAAGGGVAVRGSDSKPCPPAELTARMRAFLEELKPQTELAGLHQTRLAIENHSDALLNTLDSLKAFVDLNSSPHLGLALAPYHLQAIPASVEEAIRICGRQLFYFYAWQKADGFGQLPGHGPADFTPWLKALAAIPYAGHVNPFMHGDAAADVMAQAVAKARDCLRQCQATAGPEKQ